MEQRPKLRGVNANPFVLQGKQGFVLSDPLRLFEGQVFVPQPVALLLPLMDGRRTTGEMATAVRLRTGAVISETLVEDLVSRLDEACLLDNEHFNTAYAGMVAEFAGSAARSMINENYARDPSGLEKEFDRLLGEKRKNAAPGPLNVKGLVSPHIDFERGGEVYAAVWAEAEKHLSGKETVFILGINHSGGQADFTLTLKDFQTPWGRAPVDVEKAGRLAEVLGGEAFQEELNHRTEHSIELALLWLHYLKRDVKFVPVLCGSFYRYLEQRKSPLEDPTVRAVVQVLKESRDSSFFIAAADLCHVGPAFGDPPLDLSGRARLRSFDEDLVRTICAGSADDLFRRMIWGGMEMKVCGFSAIYVLKAVLEGMEGAEAGYQRCPADGQGTSFVSICGALFGQRVGKLESLEP